MIGIIIVAAVVALMQINAQRTKTDGPIAAVASTLLSSLETGISLAVSSARSGAGAIASLPRLETENGALRTRNRALTTENSRLHELAAAYAAETSARVAIAQYGGIEARVVGFPPENELRVVTIDRGARAGIHRDDGVMTVDGVVGRIAAVGPFSSTVVLLTDYTSRIPAIVRRGRWWGIARGNLGSVRLEYVPQDAPLMVGDVVVTGEGRSFHSGVPIGTVTALQRGDATLYQTAVIKPSAALGALDRVVVVPR